MAININFHGVTRVCLSNVSRYTGAETGKTFCARSIVITCDDGATQEIGLYSDSENALELDIAGESMANARLWAAAPDMLSALRRAVLALAFAAESSPAMHDDYNAVSAAIDKATGAPA